jgi:AcrR family transcriptional regulator
VRLSPAPAAQAAGTVPDEPSAPASAPDARRRPSRAERRAQILRAGAECFGTRGFHGTTTRDIAAAVGITEAALYRHFRGKDAIYAAILDERIAASDLLAPLEPAARAGRDRAVFGGLALAILETVEADPSFLRLMLYSALEGHEMARPFQETRIRRYRDFTAGYIARRMREGAFRGVDPVLAARAFIGMVVDHLIVRQVFGQRDAYPQPPQEVAETFVSIFLDGVCAKPALPRRRAGSGSRARQRRARRG